MIFWLLTRIKADLPKKQIYEMIASIRNGPWNSATLFIDLYIAHRFYKFIHFLIVGKRLNTNKRRKLIVTIPKSQQVYPICFSKEGNDENKHQNPAESKARSLHHASE